MELIKELGRRIQKARKEKGLTQQDVYKRQQESLVESVLEYIQGMGIVKAFGLERDSTQSIGSAIKASCRDNLKPVSYTHLLNKQAERKITKGFSSLRACVY